MALTTCRVAHTHFYIDLENSLLQIIWTLTNAMICRELRRKARPYSIGGPYDTGPLCTYIILPIMKTLRLTNLHKVYLKIVS